MPLCLTLSDEHRFPNRMAREEFLPYAYRVMYYTRTFEALLLELFKKGYVKGTVALSTGNEATAVAMASPMRPGRDVTSLLHRDFASHLIWGATTHDLLCQFMANAESPTHGREGNVHHGNAAQRRFPMISHLGRMISPVVGGTWAARRNGEDAFGLSITGDGGSSTGEFHESLNVASVLRVPVLFVVENNYYSFSTPINAQYRCKNLSDRAAGFGMTGLTIDGTDPWLVYSTVCDLLEKMQAEQMPALLECVTLRLLGHAAYDKGEYVSEERLADWRRRDPVPCTRKTLAAEGILSERELAALETEIDQELRAAIARAMTVPRPDPATQNWAVYAPRTPQKVEPYRAAKVKHGDAVRRALEYILEREPKAAVLGLDVGVYGSAFKTCKGLIDRFGADRVIDMPLCEPSLTGFCLGASQVGARPILEFQFADFGTEATTQLGLNTGSWYFRSGSPAPVLFRFPCGGGLTLGPFHSGEFEGLWSRFPGLKILYPATAQETFEALVAGFFDPNPCLVMEHKLHYWSRTGDIDFDGDLEQVWRPRHYLEGGELTLVAIGAIGNDALAAVAMSGRSVDVWNPFVLAPLDIRPILESVERTGRLLVVQEAPETQGLGDRLVSLIVRSTAGRLLGAPRLLASPDMPVPFAPELESHCRPGVDRIRTSIDEMLETR